VHGVFHVVPGDEKVAVEIGDGHVGDDKAVAIVVEDEAAADFVAGGGFVFREFFAGRGGSRLRLGSGLLGAGGLREQEAVVGKLFDKAAFLEFAEHLEEGTAGEFLDLEGVGEVFEGDSTVSKFKKTQDVIRAEARRARHEKDPFPGSEGV